MVRQVRRAVSVWEPGMTDRFLCGITKPLTPEAKAELDDFERWLHLPKPRPEFHAWRAAVVRPLEREQG